MDLYGITNCDTVKKARAYLDKKKINYTFHDFKKELPTKKQIDIWLKQVPWEELLNMRGMTWRKLSDSERATINKTNAIKLMLEKPSIIKRPILEIGNKIILGFDAAEYQKLPI
jgi:arsenate reductase